MKLFFRNTFLVSSLALSVGIANAAEGLSITPIIGYQTYDNQLKNDEVYGIGLGYHFGNGLAVEAAGHFGGAGIIDTGSNVNRFSNADRVDHGYVDTQQYRGELQYWIPTGSFVSPYLSFGLGSVNYTAIKAGDNSPVPPGTNLPFEPDDASFLATIFGAGLGMDLTEQLMLRGDFRYLQYDMASGVNEIDDLQYGLGLSWLPFNSAEAPAPVPVPVVEKPMPKDTDGDGVYDDMDKCPGTLPGVQVDATGCEIVQQVIEAPVIVVTDSDGDGVPDDMDACPNTPYGVAVDASGCAYPKVLEQTVSKDLAVYFETDSATLTADSYAEVQSLADFMNEYPTTIVVVEGHTDSTGSNAYNQALSERRSGSVANALTGQYGIDDSRVSSVGYGEERPVADNATKEGRALNRRATAVINETVSIGE